MDTYVATLERIFRETPDKYVAHERGRDVLLEMAADPTVLREALRRNLRDPGLLAGHYPVVALSLAELPAFELVANCWLPLPDRATDVTTKAIHHHGPMLLTTVTALGPGYEHWTFTTPRLVDPSRELFEMEVIEHGPHPAGHAAFVDAYVAHVPLFVPSFTVTFALWSSRDATSWKDRVKRVPALKRRAAALRRIGTRLGLARALDLKNIEYFDFFPGEESFVGMRQRIEFPRGPAIDRVRSVAHILQESANESLVDLLVPELDRLGPTEEVSSLREALRTGAPVAPALSTGHYGVEFANFRRTDIERVLAARSSTPG